MSARALPLAAGSRGPAVRDLRARLAGAGLLSTSLSDVFDDGCATAVREFQTHQGLHSTGEVDANTWACLVESGFLLGDRLIFLTRPMLRGDDVSQLQLHLGALGFNAGKVDGIFGPVTQSAVLEFQQNLGLVTDAVCGPDTVESLTRLQLRGGATTVAGVRERRKLRLQPSMIDRPIALAHIGTARFIVGRIAADLRLAGFETHLVESDDWSSASADMNDSDVSVCLAWDLSPLNIVEISHFATEGFESASGARMARCVADQLPALPDLPLPTLRGMRLPVLRETRAPAIMMRLGPDNLVESHATLLGPAIARALTRWSRPIEIDEELITLNPQLEV